MKIIKYLISFLVIIGLLITADYFALFGTKTKKVLDFSELKFKPSDANTGRPIFSARAICFRHQNHDICTMKEGKVSDTVSALFPVHKVLTKTWLFEKSAEYNMPADPNIKIMIIHNDYHSVSDDYDMRDIHGNSGQTIKVEMHPK